MPVGTTLLDVALGCTVIVVVLVTAALPEDNDCVFWAAVMEVVEREDSVEAVDEMKPDDERAVATERDDKRDVTLNEEMAAPAEDEDAADELDTIDAEGVKEKVDAHAEDETLAAA